MTDHLTALTSRGPLLTKRWTAEGIQAYDRAKWFSVEELPVSSLKTLADTLEAIQTLPMCCVIRGKLRPGLDPSSTDRTLESFADTPRQWVCLDIDGFEPVLDDPVTCPAEAVQEFISTRLPREFHGVSHHWQLSSSAGAPGKEHLLKAHLWFWLDRPVHGAELDAWARFTSSPVDITVFRTVQAHYTASPIFDQGVTDPVATRSGTAYGLSSEVEIVLAPTDWVRETTTPGRGALKDPTAKTGLIGAWCRVYDPVRCIEEILPEHFEFEDEGEVRVTWLQGGGTPGGACITDDGLHVFNSHATDPFEGRACNTWDLTRVHRFGHLDVGASDFELDQMASTPSYVAMKQLAQADPEVQAELSESARAEFVSEFQRADEERGESTAEAVNSETPASTPAKPATRTKAAADAEEELGRLLAAVERCETGSEVELKSQALRDIELTVIERQRVATAIQNRIRALTGTKPTIGAVRQMIAPPPRAGAAGAPEWLQEWVYVTDGDTFFNTRSKESVKRAGFDALHTMEMPLVPNSQFREHASQWAVDVWGIVTVTNLTYAPGHPPVFTLLGKQWANTYREGSVPETSPVGGEDAISIVENHLRLLVPDERERELLTSWIAHNVKHPGKKIRWSPYVYGPQGCGKTFLLHLLAEVMGHDNVRVLAGTTLKSDFNGWAVGHAVVGIEEVYQMGQLYDNEAKLKPSISNDSIDVHRKGKDSYSAPNFSNIFMLSNYPDGYPAGEGDRRAFFIKCAITEGQAKLLAQTGHYVSLFNALYANVGALRRWLLQHVAHSEFAAEGRAPITAARETVIQMSKTDHEVEALGLLEGLNYVTTQWLVKQIEGDRHDAPKTRALAKLLERNGFEFCKVMKVDGVSRRVWMRAGAVSVTNDAIVAELKRSNPAAMEADYPD